VIKRKVALMDQDLLGLSLTVYIQVSLGSQVPGMLEHFEEVVADYPEVLECSLVTGSDADYLLRAVIPDMSHYEKFLLRQLNQIVGVSHFRTGFPPLSAYPDTPRQKSMTSRLPTMTAISSSFHSFCTY
jgi:Lrp/AsnC family leucine-responsive transcriptional regulator